jgi:hypothetical protein
VHHEIGFYKNDLEKRIDEKKPGNNSLYSKENGKVSQRIYNNKSHKRKPTKDI